MHTRSQRTVDRTIGQERAMGCCSWTSRARAIRTDPNRTVFRLGLVLCPIHRHEINLGGQKGNNSFSAWYWKMEVAFGGPRRIVEEGRKYRGGWFKQIWLNLMGCAWVAPELSPSRGMLCQIARCLCPGRGIFKLNSASPFSTLCSVVGKPNLSQWCLF